MRHPIFVVCIDGIFTGFYIDFPIWLEWGYTVEELKSKLAAQRENIDRYIADAELEEMLDDAGIKINYND
jgi:hypothetical protein